MVNLTPDIIAKIRLYSKEEGGRINAIPSIQFGCPLYYEGEYFDCRLLLDQVGITLELGSCAIVPIKFLNPSFIKPRIHPGSSFKLWEMRYFAEGEVVEVIS